MMALTLTQPWATLVAIGAKHIETRSWATAYRGPLAIHAAHGLGPVGGVAGLRELVRREPFRRVLTERAYDLAHQPNYTAYIADRRRAVLETPEMLLPRGCIVAVCELADCTSTDYVPQLVRGWERDGQRWQLTDQERAFGDYTPGRYAWLLANVRPLRTPLPARGGRRLWYWDAPANLESLLM